MWFRSIFDSPKSPSAGAPSRSKKRRPPRRRAAPRLRLEALETRCLLTFAAPVSAAPFGYDVGGGPVVAADLANNGIQDLVVVNNPGWYDAGLAVLMGNGDGTFGPPAGITVPDAFSLAVGDLTGNGKLDIVTANDNSVSVLLGNGNGTFQAPITFDLPEVGSSFASPQAVALGDMNHDGKLDAVVVAGTQSAEYVEVLLGHGDGTFTLGSTTLVGPGYGGRLSLGDFNGEGNLDVATTTNSGVAAVLLGNGDGTLGAPTDYALFPEASLAVGDVNGDGKLYLVATGGAGDTAAVSVLLGNGDGTFQAAKNTAFPIPTSPGYGISPDSLVMGDLNGDGKLDVAVTGEYSYLGGGYSNVETNVYVLLGNGDGTFTAAQTIPLPGNGGSSVSTITAADFSGDGYLDLAVSNENNVWVLMNEANWSPPPGGFAVSGFPASTQAGTPGTFTVTALNADATVDTAYTGTVSFTSTDGQATLPGVYQFTSGDAGVHAFSATLKTAGTQSITASYGTATGSETAITVTPAAASHLAVSVPVSSTAGSAFSVTVTALDAYDNTATSYDGAVHFTTSDGQAILPGDYTFTSTDAGSHTFTNGVTLKTSGSQTVTATDTVSGSTSGGSAVAVSPAAASTMNASGFPSPITAGVAGTFTVAIKDAYGNVATGYTGTVSFSSSDGQASLPASYTFAAANAGTHTFVATLKTAGTQWIKATDGALAATDADITVKPAAASKFILIAPSSVEPGVAFSLTVKVEDAYGNVVTGYVGTVHFSSSDNRAALPANYTFTAGDDGVHTFTGLVLKKKENQTITVTDTKNSSLTGKTVVDVL